MGAYWADEQHGRRNDSYWIHISGAVTSKIKMVKSNSSFVAFFLSSDYLYVDSVDIPVKSDRGVTYASCLASATI